MKTQVSSLPVGHLPSALGHRARVHPRPDFLGMSLVAGIYLGCLIALFTVNAGCGTTPLALSREQKLYQAGTNIVGSVERLAPALPAPFSSAAEGGAALAAAALAAWNVWQHKQINGLKNGQGIAAAAKVAQDSFVAGHAAGVKQAADTAKFLVQPGGPATT